MTLTMWKMRLYEYKNEFINLKLLLGVRRIEKELIPFGEEWHWDNPAIEDEINEVLKILKSPFRKVNKK